MVQKRNNLYTALRKYHVPRRLAYKLTVTLVKR